ncbi:MAG TPA: class I SAM-dependent methyltransferase [Ktedonobacteraceae bacterium]|jgi:SAM-dependent methyltransferase
MSPQSDQHKEKEHPSTYFVQDRTNTDERARVRIQDTMITKAMGGALPEQADPTFFRRVIDIGCGTGGWLIETARSYPDISLLVGVDISSRMVEFARNQAEAEQVGDRVEFHVMDVLRATEFPHKDFDLLNQRLGWSYLRTWDWPNLLAIYHHVTRLGGIIRITESDVLGTSTSPALTQLYDLARDALYQAGHLFTPEQDGVTGKLPDLFRYHGIKDIQTRTTLIEYHHGTEMKENFVEDIKLLFRTLEPFIRKWSHIPNNYDEIYHQASVRYSSQTVEPLDAWSLYGAPIGSRLLLHITMMIVILAF